MYLGKRNIPSTKTKKIRKNESSYEIIARLQREKNKLELTQTIIQIILWWWRYRRVVRHTCPKEIVDIQCTWDRYNVMVRWPPRPMYLLARQYCHATLDLLLFLARLSSTLVFTSTSIRLRIPSLFVFFISSVTVQIVL